MVPVHWPPGRWGVTGHEMRGNAAPENPKISPSSFSFKCRPCALDDGMTPDRSWLDDLQGVDALAILTDADLLSHENGHSLFYDGIEPLLDQCLLISADPLYLFQNLKHVKPCSERSN
jgi:hypothetical protein